MNDEKFDPMDAFEEIIGSYSSTAHRRHPKGGTAHPTGLLPLNTNGSDLLTQLIVDSKQDRDTCQVYLRANPLTKTVAVEVVSANTPGGLPLRRNKDQRTYTLYLHPVFEKHPSMRPDTRVKVGITRGTAKGKDCLLINLKGLATRLSKREDESGQQSKA